MSSETRSRADPKAWLKPDQVDRLVQSARFTGPSYLRGRNEAMIALAYDTGLRPGEITKLRTEHFDADDGVLVVPGDIQKEYPTESTSPSTATLELEVDDRYPLVDLLDDFLARRWKDADGLFPSREGDFMTTRSFENVVHRIADDAGVEPFLEDRSRGDPDDVSPHTFRHSLVYRMLRANDGYTFYDVRSRLRHRSIKTTEDEYDHFDTV
jgi:integrase/recombinase XerC/integrase/recombinase XerD